MRCQCLSTSTQQQCRSTTSKFLCPNHSKLCKTFFSAPHQTPYHADTMTDITFIEQKPSKTIKVVKNDSNSFFCVKFKVPFDKRALDIENDKGMHNYYDWHEFLFLNKTLHHDHVIKAFDAGISKDKLYIIFPLFQGNLDYLPKVLPDITQKEMMIGYIQMLEALTHLQEKEILHRDICSRNVLFKCINEKDDLLFKKYGRFMLVLADFDLSIIVDQNTNYRLTPGQQKPFIGKRAYIHDDFIVYGGEKSGKSVPIGFHKDLHDLGKTFKIEVKKLDFNIKFKTKQFSLFFASCALKFFKQDFV
jgi:serine/threonine protein kinase